MEKELNLVELLKDAPKGTKLYSPIFGECELVNVFKETETIGIKADVTDGYFHTFYKNGSYYKDYGECLLFPSKDNRDWSAFTVETKVFKVGDYIKEKDGDNVFKIKKQDDSYVTLMKILADSPEDERIIDAELLTRYEKVEKFNPKWLKSFDRVLIYDSIWVATLFSHSTNIKDYPYIMCNSEAYKFCIPFNGETKHLIGTTEDEPEFYKI